MPPVVLSVRQLNSYVRSLIEGDVKLLGISITGEISNLKDHYASGHIYFTLKDSDAAINCVMFRTSAARLKFRPENGQKVVLKGRVSVYERDGQYQFYAEEMVPDGIGDIALAFEQIKQKLEKQGLFDPDTKRALPRFPKRIALVTSPSGAAVQDMINILSRRWPMAELVLCPVSVQGEAAPKEMIHALDRLYKLSGIDIAIIGRGGGSIEDLWAFNNEELAYKIYEAPFPIISAVGHQTDFTISDFVADLRAPTPSAAAELAVPDKAEIEKELQKQATHLRLFLQNRYEACKAKLGKYAKSRFFENSADTFVNRRFEMVDRLNERLISIMQNRLQTEQARLAQTVAVLDSLSPLKTISRGFAAVKKENQLVTSVSQLKENEMIELCLSDGEATCEIKTITRRNLDESK